MQIISNMALISINETLIVQLISFLVFLFVLNRVMIRPLRNVMQDRENYIENVRNDIQAAQAKIETISGQIQRQEVEVRNEAFKFKEELEESGQQKAKEIFASARKEIGAANQKIKADIEHQLTEAKTALQDESEALAVKMIEKILDRRIAQ